MSSLLFPSTNLQNETALRNESKRIIVEGDSKDDIASVLATLSNSDAVLDDPGSEEKKSSERDGDTSSGSKEGTRFHRNNS